MTNIEQSNFGGAPSPGALATARRGAVGSLPLPASESVVIAKSLLSNVDVHKTLAVKRGDDDFVISHISRASAGFGLTESQPRRPVYTACVHLREFSSYDIWCDETRFSGTTLPQNSLHINDMRHSWHAAKSSCPSRKTLRRGRKHSSIGCANEPFGRCRRTFPPCR